MSSVLQPRNSIENVYHWSCGYRLTMGLPAMGLFDISCFYLSTVLMPLAVRVFHIYIYRMFVYLFICDGIVIMTHTFKLMRTSVASCQEG